MAPPYGFHTTATEVASDLASSIRGKTVLTTGVTPNSLGSHFVETIAAHAPALLILASRTQDTIDATTAAIHAKHPDVPIRGVVVDLSALASVRRAADEVVKMQQDEGIVIDVLMLNAGIMACPYGTTADGFERQFGTNHLGHFVFANRIIPGMLAKSKQPRVVAVSSEGHQLGPIRWADPGFRGGESYDKWRSYGQAKTANCLYAWALADKLGAKGVLAFSLHPGAIMTNLGRHIDIEGDDWSELISVFDSNGNPQGSKEYWEKTPFKTLDEGTSTHVVAAFGNGLEKDNGKFLRDAQICSFDMVGPWARNSYDAERLWKMSEEMVSEKFNF
ncbi:Ww domain containing oxidoreductase protein [Lasiodiplodia theobromae]|uniref:Retinol dehydrogenase 14 n=1 Tax=Lasiodiplodia theobromae TaxID=45133 RepID=A0A5N5DLT2_9PEZI|nr:Ww domain containing oxidoreductase protein [Lasiodiplodia theobromae]KAB2578281.1 Retinol dehydrogenase 14 [Lasiodiplodia theobromae]KAF4544878.1 Ww domain containing oxidoreductase protein [Lasiodiplodia theobromae]